MITIRSTSSNRALRVGEPSGTAIPVELIGYPVSAVTEIWVDTGDAFSLADFFNNLGQLQGAWSGAKEWKSLEGDFRLSVTCSALGAVTFHVELRGLQGAPEEWRVEVGIESEFGQLEYLAREAQGLKNASNNAI